MNVLDIIFIIPILWLAYKGFTKGLVVEISTLVALILGVYAALHFSDLTADLLRENLHLRGEYLNITSFVVTFLLVVIVVNLIGRLVTKLMEMVALSFLNRSLGGLLGIAKAVVFLSFALFFVHQFDKNNVLVSQNLKDNSMLYPYVQPVAPQLIDWFSDIDFDSIKEEFVNKQQ